jgi:hypothetical protein
VRIASAASMSLKHVSSSMSLQFGRWSRTRSFHYLLHCVSLSNLIVSYYY